MITKHTASGFKTLLFHWKLFVLLLAWNLVWGIVLTMTLSSGLKELLLRLPTGGSGDPDLMYGIFMFELIPFLAHNEAFLQSFIVTIALLVLRWLLSPFINAGVYTTAMEEETSPFIGTFLKGVNQKGGSYFLLGSIQFIVLSVLWGLLLYAIMYVGQPLLAAQVNALLPTIAVLVIGAVILVYVHFGFSIAKVRLQQHQWQDALSNGFRIGLKSYFPLFGMLLLISITMLILSVTLAVGMKFLGLYGAVVSAALVLLRLSGKLWRVFSQISFYNSLP